MKTLYTSTAILLLLTFQSTSQVPEKELKEKLPQIEQFLKEQMEARKIPGLAYGIFDEDEIVVSGTYGLANVQHQVPVKIETIFPLASVTKQFTAAAILILQQDGKLKVSDKLCQYLEECPDEWSEITIHQLLTHTSGLPAPRKKDGRPNLLAEFSGVQKMHPVRVGMEINSWSKQFHFDLIKTDTLDNPPGTVMNYSNVGYMLLGMIIDNLSGSYRDFLQERIFKASGMSSTYIQDLETIHFNEVKSYTLRNGKLINIRNLYQLEITGSYGVHSNIPDLQKWDAILNTKKILTDESKTLLWTKHTLANGKPIQVRVPGLKPFNGGYGWAILPDSAGRKVVWHNGSAGTEFLKAVDNKMSVVVLTNLGEGNYDRVVVHGLTEGVANILDIYQ